MEQTIDIIIINLSVYFSFIAFYFSEKILFWRQFFSFHDNEIYRKECDQAVYLILRNYSYSHLIVIGGRLTFGKEID